jgi:hypothetical protein
MTRKKTGWLILALVVLSYTFMYTQSDRFACNDDCEKINSLNTALHANRNYVSYVLRCGQNPVSDTLCLWVKDTTGIDWNLFADTACLLATQNGLYKQKFFIITYDTSTLIVDTLVRKQCP